MRSRGLQRSGRSWPLGGRHRAGGWRETGGVASCRRERGAEGQREAGEGKRETEGEAGGERKENKHLDDDMWTPTVVVDIEDGSVQ